MNDGTDIDASNDVVWDVSIGDARKMLVTDKQVSFNDSSHNQSPMRAAVKAARDGNLFVVENLPSSVINARLPDAVDAVMRGIVRPPYERTYLLMKVDDTFTVLLCITDDGFVDDETENYGLKFWGVFPRWHANGDFGWCPVVEDDGVVSSEATEKVTGQIASWGVAVLSLIADSRSGAKRIVADDKLQRARVRRGKEPILPYWCVDTVRPTILTPNSASVLNEPVKQRGTHASPRPHDRRAHPRYLTASGRTIWVRSSKVNALIPYLTLGRSHYEVRGLD